MASTETIIPAESGVAKEDDQRPKKKKKKSAVVLRDFSVLCLSVFLSSMAYCGLINLQTSLLDDGQLGNKALTVVYFFAAVSTVALTSPTIARLGLKWTLVASVGTQVTFPVANFWPTWYVLYPAAAITGLGTGPLWSAANAYLLTLGGGAEATIALYFGVFFMAQRVATVTGSLVSSVVFQRPHVVAAVAPPATTVEAFCGACYCYEDLGALFGNGSATAGNASDIYRPSELQLHVLFGTYLSGSLVAVPLMALLTPREGATRPDGAPLAEMLLETLRILVHPKLLLLLPLATFSGVTYAFSTADYIVGYITCTVGIDQIGYIMAAFGVASALGSIVCGPLVKFSGRQAIFIFGGGCNLGTLVALAAWTPTSEAPLVLYAFAALLGLTCIVWVSQLAAFVGFLFAEDRPERAFAAYLLFQMLGNFAWHAFSLYLCLDLQIYGQAALLLVGLVCYVVLEGLLCKETTKPPPDDPVGNASISPVLETDH